MTDSLKNKVVLITGASSGIGAACAIAFAGCGSRLALTGRDADRLASTAQKCKEAGVSAKNILTIIGDVTKQEDVTRIVDSTIKYFDRLDILLNNAGATRAKNVWTCEMEDLDFCFNALVRSVFMMTKACLPALEQTKGSIINMSSLAGLRPLHYALPYSMCKNMVDQFTKASSVDIAKKGIRINCVNPATVKTDIFTRGGGPGGSEEGANKYLEWCTRAIPMGRIGQMHEITNTVLFLASDQAGFICGATIPIDGSYSNTCSHVTTW